MRRNENDFLRKAKKNKNDEFYTQYEDIEKELKYYVNHFEGKTVYCNCDDPTISNFYKYFAINFKKLKLKKLIASCYIEQKMDLFSLADNNSNTNGYYYEYYGLDDEKIIPSMDDVKFFKSDGDFRSEECLSLLEESDVIVTNPPFSLFREFISMVMDRNKKFLIIGNINSITYKNVFEFIKANKLWLGVHMGRGISGFIVPENYELYGTETKTNDKGQKIISPNNCLWLTNLDLKKRHEDIPLTKTYSGNENLFQKYDNYDGINVNKTLDIPIDYPKGMGVPITFLHKFNPEQFEILGFRKGDDGKDLSINGKNPYFRILVKNKKVKP